MEHEFENTEKELRGALDAWRDSVHGRAERPEWFWARQRARIRAHVPEQSNSRAPKLAWAGLAATVALAVAMLIPTREVKPIPQPAASTAAHAEISDHDLMVALERTMNAGVPSSLAPAGLLAQEMNQALETNIQTQKSKEKEYEE